MIIDNVSSLTRYPGIITGAEQIQEFIKNLNLRNFKAGEWLILNDRLKVMVLERDNYTAGLMEAHEKLNDIHVTLKGIDCIRVADRKKLQPHKVYDAELDYGLWAGEETILIKNAPGTFAFLTPDDAHNNCFQEPNTVKLVFKVPVV